ncbi:MAG: alanyl-tRNA editing protein [Candidatus Aenigmatarchaeota archaeon]|nr:MAG: alanyl-tRNA editing protein [Candidatus Aenigmarchaeota archaeon]
MDALYMDDSYTKEFEAKVESVTKGGENKFFVVLDKTAFYPNSGGQPHDTGKFVKEGVEYPVVYVGKFSGKISHEVSKEGLKEGDVVKGAIEWERRYALMRMHTAAHIISEVFHRDSGAFITGNQLDFEKSRIDFSLEDFDREKMTEYFAKANEIVGKDLNVKTYSLPREEAMKIENITKLANVLPPDVKELRIVEIEGFDIQADGGTHVKSTKEIGKIEFIKAENKGKNNRRVYFKVA